jgi:hypothetical protein
MKNVLNKRIIAKTITGQEYLYSKVYYQVSKASASIICNAMNASNYQIKPGTSEYWKVYEAGDYTYKNAFYKAVLRKGKVFFYEIWKAI